MTETLWRLECAKLDRYGYGTYDLDQPFQVMRSDMSKAEAESLLARFPAATRDVGAVRIVPDGVGTATTPEPSHPVDSHEE